MDWFEAFEGKESRKAPYFMRKSIVSGVDFPLNQSFDLSVHMPIKDAYDRSGRYASDPVRSGDPAAFVAGATPAVFEHGPPSDIKCDLWKNIENG